MKVPDSPRHFEFDTDMIVVITKESMADGHLGMQVWELLCNDDATLPSGLDSCLNTLGVFDVTCAKLSGMCQ